MDRAEIRKVSSKFKPASLERLPMATEAQGKGCLRSVIADNSVIGDFTTGARTPTLAEIFGALRTLLGICDEPHRQQQHDQRDCRPRPHR